MNKAELAACPGGARRQNELMSDTDILAGVLGDSRLAARLLRRFGGLRQVLHADAASLAAEQGIGRSRSSMLRALPESSAPESKLWISIAAGVRMLRSGDVLLVAGKGHESGQKIGDQVLPFSDHEVVRGALGEIRRRA